MRQRLGAVHPQPIVEGAVPDILDPSRQLCPHRAEVDVRHGGDQRLLGQQRARVEALLEEVAGAVVLEVRAPGDGLLEVLHNRSVVLWEVALDSAG